MLYSYATDTAHNVWYFSNGGVSANALSWSKITTATNALPTAATSYFTDYFGNSYWLNTNGTISGSVTISVTTPITLTVSFTN